MRAISEPWPGIARPGFHIGGLLVGHARGCWWLNWGDRRHRCAAAARYLCGGAVMEVRTVSDAKRAHAIWAGPRPGIRISMPVVDRTAGMGVRGSSSDHGTGGFERCLSASYIHTRGATALATSPRALLPGRVTLIAHITAKHRIVADCILKAKHNSGGPRAMFCYACFTVHLDWRLIVVGILLQEPNEKSPKSQVPQQQPELCSSIYNT